MPTAPIMPLIPQAIPVILPITLIMIREAAGQVQVQTAVPADIVAPLVEDMILVRQEEALVVVHLGVATVVVLPVVGTARVGFNPKGDHSWTSRAF